MPVLPRLARLGGNEASAAATWPTASVRRHQARLSGEAVSAASTPGIVRDLALLTHGPPALLKRRWDDRQAAERTGRSGPRLLGVQRVPRTAGQPARPVRTRTQGSPWSVARPCVRASARPGAGRSWRRKYRGRWGRGADDPRADGDEPTPYGPCRPGPARSVSGRPSRQCSWWPSPWSPGP